MENTKNVINSYVEYAKFYDYDQRNITKDDIPFFIDYAKKVNGDILELACGTGRVLLPLAKEGFNVTGIDKTEEMLEQFKKKLSNFEVASKVTLYNADMTSFDLGREFPLVTIPYRTFQLLIDEEDQKNCLKMVRNHLTDDGLFIITVFFPGGLDESWTTYPEQEDWVLKNEQNGLSYKGTNVKKGIDVKNQIMYPQLKVYETDKNGNENVYTQEIGLKYYEEDQIIGLLQNSGFSIEEKFGYYDKRPIGKGSEMIFVCKKVTNVKKRI